MPRPQPIIIPGPMGMGGSWKKTETNLQLDKILNLIGGIQALRNDAANKQANELGAAQAMNALFPARQPMAQDMETGAPVEAAGPATPASIQYPDIAKSPIGQQAIFDLLGKSQKATGEDKWTVETIGDKKYQVYGDGRKIELGPSGQGDVRYSPTTLEKLGPDGKKHYYSMDPSTGKFNIDQGEKPPEEYKVMRAIGRGGISRRAIVQDPNTGVQLYQDSMNKGTREEVPPEDSQFMRPMTIRGIEAGQAAELAGMKNTFNRLTDVYKRSEELSDKFGPLSGRLANIKNKFMEDGPTQAIMNELKSMITIAYSLSGKQISQQEMKMLQEAILPTLNQPYGNFQETLKFARDWVGQMHDDRIDAFDKAFFDVNEPYLIRGKANDDLSFTRKPTGEPQGGVSGRFTIKEIKEVK